MLSETRGGVSIYATKPNDLKRGDEVELAGRERMIITRVRPNAPVNCWCGVKVKGLGKEYIFGPGFNVKKIASHGENHPALQRNAERIAEKAEAQIAATGHAMITVEQKEQIGALIFAVRSGDLSAARDVADGLHVALGPWS